MLGFFKRLFGSPPKPKNDNSKLTAVSQVRDTRANPVTTEDKIEATLQSTLRTMDKMSAEIPGRDYFVLLEALQEAISKRDYSRAADAAQKSISPLRDWLNDPKGDGARLQIRIPALQQGGTMMAFRGNLEGLERLRDLVNEFDHLESYRPDAAKHFKSLQLFQAIRALISSKPGVLQNRVKTELGEENGRHVANLISWLEKSGEISRVQEGKTHALYMTDSIKAKQPDPPRKVEIEPSHRLAKANTSSNSETFANRTYRFVAVDVETANRQHSSICQIGLAMVSNTGAIETVGMYVDPEQEFDQSHINIHGIDAAKVAGAPNFRAAIQSFRPFLERHVLVQHSNFDKQAFNAASKLYGIPELRTNWIDSVKIARKAWPELKGNGGHGLANLKAFLELEFEHHNAEEDARAAAEIVLLAEARTGSDFSELAKSKTQNYQTSVAISGNQNGALYGHVACFTGQLSMSRVEAATLAAGAGITVKTGVSKKISLLVVGDQDLSTLAGHNKSSKHRRAEELQNQGHEIKILGESEFLELIKLE